MSTPPPSNPRDSPPSPARRRSSFVDMFGPRPGMSGHNIGANGQPRRLSVNTIGLSSSLTSGATSQSATSPFGMGLGFTRARAESLSSSTHSGSVDESPFEDDAPGPPAATSVPVTPFGTRRVSFGANKALGGSGGNNGGGNGDAGGGGSAPTSAGRPGSSPGNGRFSGSCPASLADCSDGYDFAERLRARAERSSVSAASYAQPHHRSRSSAASTSAAAAAAAATAAAAAAAAAATAQPAPAPKTRKVPDAFQERILKGDFYLD